MNSTPEPCSVALKEWAVICRALETGQQTLLLRKGGIREGAGGFQPEHERFWLYPTQFHQGAEQLAAEFVPLLNNLDAPANGLVQHRNLAQVTAVSHLGRLEQAAALRGLHGWSDEVIAKRFHYRDPGLLVLVLRVYRCQFEHQVKESSAMAGCKSWVELPQALATGQLAAVLDDIQWSEVTREIASRLAMAH
jgi:hypothetical protein